MDVLVLGLLAFAVALAAVLALVRAARAGSAVSVWTLGAATVAGVGTGVAATLLVRSGDAERTAPENDRVGASSSAERTTGSASDRRESSGPGDRSGRAAGAPAASPRIETTTAMLFGRPHETILIPGRYHGVRGPRELRVEVRRDGRWTQFPLPVVTARSGHFSAYVYLGRTGYYQLRLVDPKQGRTSRRLVLELF